MEHNTIEMVKQKLDEYGFTVFKHHPVDEKQYVFFCSDRVLFVFPLEHGLSISFQATIKPDEAANHALILKEIPDIDVEIMESFIYSNDNKLISGDAAYKLIEDVMKEKAVKTYKEEMFYEQLLNNVDCFEC